jgi:hypothetical protein
MVLGVASRSLTKEHGARIATSGAFFLYVAVTVTLAGCVVYFGWGRTWSSVYVPSMYPPFADMRVIQGAVRSLEHGYDPRIANVGDPSTSCSSAPQSMLAPSSFRPTGTTASSSWSFAFHFCSNGRFLAPAPSSSSCCQNETLLIYWFSVTGLIVAQLAKTVIFAVLSAYLLALAWGTLASVYVKPKSATAATN